MAGAFTFPTFSPNVLSIIAGLRPIVQIGPWVTGGGAATLTDIGHKSKIQFGWKKTYKDIEPEDVLGAVGDFPTKNELDLKGTIHQLEPATIALMNSENSSQVVTVARVAGVTDGTLTYGFDDPAAGNYVQVVLTGAVNATISGVTYTALQVTLWRCRGGIAKGPGFGKTSESTLDFDLKAFYDSTVTGSTPFNHYGKWQYILPA